VAVGRVARPHGIRGALKIQLHDPDSTTLLEVRTVTIAGRSHAVERARPHGVGAALVELHGIATIEQADALRGQLVEIDRADLAFAPGEYLVADLVGCEAFDPQGRALGAVVELYHNGAHDVLVLTTGHMVPLVDEWVVAVDLEARRIVVEPHLAF
jgi:16S rRNA processing protein RimM